MNVISADPTAKLAPNPIISALWPFLALPGHSIFFGDIAKMEWPGQFNLDFTFMLTLSALWVAWRNAFSALGLALGLFALFGGALFLSAYLLVLSLQTNGDVRMLLLGPGRS